MIDFTPEQLERYSRQIILKEVGVEGQEKLARARVLIAGAGGLGSPAALYLATAGVGTIAVVDGDVVDLSNLQRQIMHQTADLNRPKVESAAEILQAMNPDVTVRTVKKRLCAANISDIINGYDFVIDGTDNFPAKFLINDACVLARLPLSHGGVLRFGGQTMTVLPGQTACYRCIFRNPPPPEAVSTCSEAGILGAVAGMLGTIQAAEAIKYIVGSGTLLTDTLLQFDALNMDFRKIPFSRQENCPVCGKNPVITELQDIEWPTCPTGCST